MINDASLSMIFAVVLIISGIATLKKGVTNHFDSQKGIHFKSKLTQALLLLFIGAVIGVISGLVGAGGGVMILLAIIFILHYPVHQAVGTSTVIMAITALSSMIGYARQGNVDWLMGVLIASGAVIAGIIGARYANSINEEKLNRVISWIFIILGFIMIGMRLIH